MPIEKWFEYKSIFSKNIDQWLVILKMGDISGTIFIDFTKIYRTKKYHRTVKIGKNTIKSLETVPFTSYIWIGVINFFFPWGSEVWSRQLAAVLGYTPLPPRQQSCQSETHKSLPHSAKTQREHFSADRTDIHENTAQLTGLTYMRMLLSWQYRSIIDLQT